MSEIKNEDFTKDLQLARVMTGAATEDEKLNLALYLLTGEISGREGLSLLPGELPGQLDLLGVTPSMVLENMFANSANFKLDEPERKFTRKDSRGLHVELEAKELDLLLKSDIPDDTVRAKLVKILFVERFYAPKIFDLIYKNPFKNVKNYPFEDSEDDEEKPDNLYFAGSTKEAVAKNKAKKNLDGGKNLNGDLTTLYEEKTEGPIPDNLRSLGSTFDEVQINKLAHGRDYGSKDGELERIFPLTKKQFNRKKRDAEQDTLRLLISLALKPQTLEWISDPKADLGLDDEQRSFLEEVSREYKDIAVAENFEDALRAFMRVYLGISNDVSLQRRRLAGKLKSKNS